MVGCLPEWNDVYFLDFLEWKFSFKNIQILQYLRVYARLSFGHYSYVKRENLTLCQIPFWQLVWVVLICDTPSLGTPLPL